MPPDLERRGLKGAAVVRRVGARLTAGSLLDRLDRTERDHLVRLLHRAIDGR